MEDWGAVKARLAKTVEGIEPQFATPLVADIRAALERVEHMDGQIDPLAKYIMSECPEYITGGGAVETAIRAIKALRQRVEELEVARSEASEEIERLRFYMTPGQKEDHAHVMTEYRRRVAAEKRVEELERERDAAWAVRDAGWVQTEDALTRMRTAEARLAQCVEALNYGLLLTSSWSDIRTHNWRNGVRAALAAAKGHYHTQGQNSSGPCFCAAAKGE